MNTVDCNMMVFRKTITFSIPESMLRNSVYFASKLDNEWKGLRTVRLELPTTRTLESFSSAMAYLKDPNRTCDLKVHFMSLTFQTTSLLTYTYLGRDY